ncbi:hypothetical protein C8R45DRAFT_36701 [Mycena sanguinolenta]|nr:hypothetical protein C8R45DRAFT_36701 [Mycena sanguinolenta]
MSQYGSMDDPSPAVETRLRLEPQPQYSHFQFFLATDSSVPALYSPRDIRLAVTSLSSPHSQLKPHFNGHRRSASSALYARRACRRAPCQLRRAGASKRRGGSVQAVDLFSCPASSYSHSERLILRTHASDLRLYCTVPTWSPSSDICLDLHDLHSLRTKFLLLIHDLVRALRSSGVCPRTTMLPRCSETDICRWRHHMCWCRQAPPDAFCVPALALTSLQQ